MVSLVDTAATVTKGGFLAFVQSMATKLLLGGLILVGGAAGFFYWQNGIQAKTISAQTASLTKAGLELDQANLKVSQLQADSVKNQAQLLGLNSQMLVLQASYKSATEELEGYRAKESEEAARNKPKMVERRVNSATDRVFNDLECATGNCRTE